MLRERGSRSACCSWASASGSRVTPPTRRGAGSGAVEAREPGRLGGADVVVDALFGAGLDRPGDGVAAGHDRGDERPGAPIVAVDLPSGINGDTGAVMGRRCARPQTVTFFRRKPGHLLLPGRLHCGPVEVADIGIRETRAGADQAARPSSIAERCGRRISRCRSPDGHKYMRGHAVVVSGGIASTGAARLAARGALRAGAGLVTIASPRDALAVNAAASLAVMVREADGASGLAALLADPRLNAVVLGPGGGVGAEMREKVLAALAGAGAWCSTPTR